ncbi:MAG: hypothetical protein IKO39_06030 [Treponema sp.]|nr:hypothetical protein [Treponema sp.]
MSQIVEFAKEIYSRFGTIKRARKCFLYTAKGVRLTDLYQEGGRAILGWGGSVLTVFKNVLERGASGSYFTDFSSPCGREPSRLDRALSALFADERKAFVFSGKQAALEAAISLSQESTSVWRPWNPVSLDPRTIDCIVFAPAFPWAGDIFILAAKSSLAEKLSSESVGQNHFKGETFLAAPLAAAVTRSVYDLVKALQEREEKHWFIYDQIVTKYWERKGPYLFPKVPEEAYPEFFSHCLDCQLLISPDYYQPSIVPFGADKGNFTLLKNRPFDF